MVDEDIGGDTFMGRAVCNGVVGIMSVSNHDQLVLRLFKPPYESADTAIGLSFDEIVEAMVKHGYKMPADIVRARKTRIQYLRDVLKEANKALDEIPV